MIKVAVTFELALLLKLTILRHINIEHITGFRDHSDLMGRVTPKSEVSTPVMARSRLPHDVLAQYNGKTREDLIEMVVDLKKELDGQGKKIVDLEDYIDNLLIKILDVAPILLKQDSPMMSKHHIM